MGGLPLKNDVHPNLLGEFGSRVAFRLMHDIFAACMVFCSVACGDACYRYLRWRKKHNRLKTFPEGGVSCSLCSGLGSMGYDMIWLKQQRPLLDGQYRLIGSSSLSFAFPVCRMSLASSDLGGLCTFRPISNSFSTFVVLHGCWSNARPCCRL